MLLLSRRLTLCAWIKGVELYTVVTGTAWDRDTILYVCWFILPLLSQWLTLCAWIKGVELYTVDAGTT